MIARCFNVAIASAALILASAALVILGPVPPAQAAAFCPDDWAADRALKQRDYATALRHIRPLADQGHPSSQYMLGKMYAKGQGVPRDPQEAIRWWRKAAGLGHDWAQIELHNLGLNWDRIADAPEYYDRGKAARKTVADAQRLLTELAYRPGPVDGLMGPKTCKAILTFQTDNGLPTDGLATRTLLGAMENRLAPRDGKSIALPGPVAKKAGDEMPTLRDDLGSTADTSSGGAEPAGGSAAATALEELLEELPVLPEVSPFGN